MKTNNSLQDLSGELKCIWMTSKLVSYKLCDREFDCENCEFDKVFRNLSTKNDETILDDNHKPDLLDNIINRIEREHFDSNLIYLKNQLVIKKLFGNAYYLGVNPIVLLLLENVKSTIELPGSDVKKDKVILSLIGDWGEKEFISPFNFMIIGKISIVPCKFNQNKWYSIILFNEEERSDTQLTKEEWTLEKQKAVSLLKNYNHSPGIGQSLLDGGKKIQHLYQYLGTKEYLKILNGIFSK
jgi:hypothetical protein